jgi:hypothetical protein
MISLQCPKTSCASDVVLRPRAPGDPPRCRKCLCPVPPPRLFISYRREDDDRYYVVQALLERLVGRYGPSSVFVDQSIEPGAHFPSQLEAEVRRSDTLVVIVGPQWIEGCGDQLRDVDDWVRRELELASALRLHVLPVLVADTKMPSPERLPMHSRWLADRAAARVRPGEDWDNDITKLTNAIDGLPRGNHNWFVLRELRGTPRRYAHLIVPQGTTREYTIGRSFRADLTLPGEGVSRFHAAIFEMHGGGHGVRDYRSVNGVIVNDSEVISDQRLVDGDRLLIGEYLFEYCSLDSLMRHAQQTETRDGDLAGDAYDRPTRDFHGGVTAQMGQWALVRQSMLAEPGASFAFLGLSALRGYGAMLVPLLEVARQARVWGPGPEEEPGTVRERMWSASALIAVISADEDTMDLAEECARVASQRGVPLVVLDLRTGNGTQPQLPGGLAMGRLVRAAEVKTLGSELLGALPPSVRS